MKRNMIDTRGALLDAAVRVMATQGYNGTTVDDMCSAAGVTKGAFFHHFGSKEELAVAAVGHYGAALEALCAQADYRRRLDPKERVLGYVDLRMQMIRDRPEDCACLWGMLAQEVFATHAEIQQACGTAMAAHAATLEGDLRAAKALYAPRADWDVAGVALHVQAVVQGAFVMAKATGGVEAAVDSLNHLRRYLGCLLPRVAV